MRILVDNVSVECAPNDSLLVSLLRAGLHPTGGGCLCLGGDCPHCLATVDGVAYVRTCQVRVREELTVERRHLDGAHPPLFEGEQADIGTRRPTVPTRHVHCDVAVLGLGASGREAAERARHQGKEVVTLEASEGQEVIGIYSGPLVVARTTEGTLQVHVREEIVVATGAAEIQPVAPGNDLAGLVTARAATMLAAAGIDLGRVVAVGEPPEGVDAQLVAGELLRFEGRGKVEAVVVRDEEGTEYRHECDTVSLGLGLHPRDALFRMGRDLPQARVVGDAARESDIPPCPREGTVCPCGGVEVADLESVWERGFHELELVKRATLAGTGSCQGSACIPHIRSFLQDRGKALQPPFTARPVTRQLTIGEVASGAYHHPTPRTPLHDEHLRLGAQMERSGGWWRPWTYGDQEAEYRAVREAVSIGDVSTLGKFVVSGPDAEAFLDYLYPTKVSTIRPGRSRYVLLLEERGYVLDDGLICRDDENRFTLSLTSAGSTFGELWIRDWAESKDFDVRIMNQTMSLGAINVTGPRAPELLARAGLGELPGFIRHSRGSVAGVACHIFRLSFTGELSYELHHAASDSVILWQRLLALGEDLGLHPHGLETLLDLRLEKGHIVVGQDTDYDSTPRRIHHEWAARLDKKEFIGLAAVQRTNQIPLDRQLVGLEMELPAPIDGEVIWTKGEYAGYVTSATASPTLGKAVMLGWLDLVEGELPEEVTIEGRPARRVPLPFYDPEGARARAPLEAQEMAPVTDFPSPPEPGSSETENGNCHHFRFKGVEGTRAIARPAALDNVSLPTDVPVLRIAEDEILVLGQLPEGAVSDPHAIVERETGFSAAWIESAAALEALERTCAWELPNDRPAFAQGAVADIPVKLLLQEDRVLFLVQTPYVAELEKRLS
jgi:glycine cleavage system aminomethyltransferase T